MVGDCILEKVDVWYSTLKSDFVLLNSINDNDLGIVWELI
jgi:hypothetical protein